MTITEELHQELAALREKDNTIYHGCVIARDPELPFGEMELRSQFAVAYDAMASQLKEANYQFSHLTQMSLPDNRGVMKEHGVPFIPMLFVDIDQMSGAILTLHLIKGKLMNSVRFRYQNGQTITYSLSIN